MSITTSPDLWTDAGPPGPDAPHPAVVALDEFLVWQELSALIGHAEAREADYRASGVVAAADPEYRDHRRSRVLLDSGPFHRVIVERIVTHLRRIAGALGVPALDGARIESQITASNDGDYYRLHDDNTRGCPLSRTISFVYFCHREPRRFDGGDLVLHDARGAVHVTPEQNTAVFFRSACPHEILPVRCPSRRFCDSRFTLNGWIHR